MTQIKGLDLKELHQEEDFGFHQLMLIETAKCTDAKVTPLHNAYAAAFAHFDEVLKPGGKDPMTAQLLDADNQRDQVYSSTSVQAHNISIPTKQLSLRWSATSSTSMATRAHYLISRKTG